MILTAFLTYLALGLVGAVIWYGVNVYSDITAGPDHKFGYAYKSPFTFMVCGLLCCPILNIYALYITTSVYVDSMKTILKKSH